MHNPVPVIRCLLGASSGLGQRPPSDGSNRRRPSPEARTRHVEVDVRREAVA
jgi:hypothetical protein